MCGGIKESSSVAAKFSTCRFRDDKEKVIGLLARVTRVPVETMEIVAQMKGAERGVP